MAVSLFVKNHDGWKSEGQESCFWVADREEVCPALRAEPYLGGSLPTRSTLQSGRRVCQEVCSALERGFPLYYCIVQLGAAGERSSRPAELHRHRRQWVAGPRRRSIVWKQLTIVNLDGRGHALVQ